MDLKFLDFEQPIAELEAKIKELRNVEFDNKINISDALKQLEDRGQALTESIFSNLSDWQIFNYQGILGVPIHWIILNISLPISMNCMVTGLMPTTLPLSADWRVLTGFR